MSVLGIGGVALLAWMSTFSTSVTQLLQKEDAEDEHQTCSFSYELSLPPIAIINFKINYIIIN